MTQSRWQPPPGESFLAPCEHRIDAPGPALCAKISDAVTHSVAVHPRMCARCRLSGSIDEAYLNDHIGKILLDKLELARLGFMRSEDEILELLPTVWAAVKHDQRQRARLESAIVALVEVGRVNVARLSPVLESIPELAHEPANSPASGGTKTTHAGLGAYTQ